MKISIGLVFLGRKASGSILLAALLSPFVLYAQGSSTRPHPVTNPGSALMLEGDWVPSNVQEIDFLQLPSLKGEHVVVSDVKPANGVNQHNYLTFFEGQYWLMWSDGPGREDRVGQRVKYATSVDGLKWNTPDYLTPEPPNSGKNSPYYGTRTARGFRYISRGFWQRDGELLALAALDEAAGFFGPGLKLFAFRWSKKNKVWEDAGVVYENAINNFPPKKIASGEWMMSRRKYDYKTQDIHVLIGGTAGIDKWQSFVVPGSVGELGGEEPYWWVLPDNNIVALFRDNKKSGYLFRSFSSDNGRTWSKPVRTNFPDAASKFCGLQLSDGRYILVSNANPKKRDPLVLSVSDDGIVFNKMYYLVGGRHVDYPHVIEQDGALLIAFAGLKQSVEIIKIPLSELRK
jgi:hypothetical protein